jgi:serine/threonine-protein kinase RsbW
VISVNDKNLFTLEIPGEPHALSKARSFACEVACQVGFTESEVNKIEIAVDEACSNIMEHGYADLSPKPVIHIQIRIEKRTIMIELIDHGKTFDYDGYAAPTFPDHWEKGNTRGVGLFLIRQCMDKVSYRGSTGASNCLRMVKRR